MCHNITSPYGEKKGALKKNNNNGIDCGYHCCFIWEPLVPVAHVCRDCSIPRTALLGRLNRTMLAEYNCSLSHTGLN